MQDYGIIKSVIDYIEANETTAFLKHKVVTQSNYEMAEPYICMSVLATSSDRPFKPTRAKVNFSLELASNYSGLQEITHIMTTLQAVLNHTSIINAAGEALLELDDSSIKIESDGQRRLGTQIYTARFNLHGDPQ